MRKTLGILIILLFTLFYPAMSSASSLSTPPSTIKIKLPPPKNKTEALKRIPDFVILNSILPPVIDRKKLMKQLFGSYTQEVEKILTDRKLKELSFFVTSKIRNKEFNLSVLKKSILNKLKIKLPNNEPSPFLPVYLLIGILVAVIVPFLMFMMFIPIM